jgi:CRP-like cAMP-binding protein
MEELQFLDSSARVRKVLKDLAKRHGRKVGLGYKVELRLNLTHDDIAKLAGTSRQTVTTEFRRLEQKNALSYDRRRILVKKDTELWE